MITRRSLLQRSGWAMAAAAFRPALLLASESISPVMAQLSTYMSEARNRALPDEIVEKVKQHILDTFAAMISGADLPPGRAAINFARSYGGEKISTVAGSKVLCGPIEAALTNGMLAHSDETDDSHAASQSHPGCAIVPAAFAVGEKFGISGEQLLRAVALGYDVGPRVTMTLGALSLRSEGHKSTHSIAGVFGAAAAAACSRTGPSGRSLRACRTPAAMRSAKAEPAAIGTTA